MVSRTRTYHMLIKLGSFMTACDAYGEWIILSSHFFGSILRFSIPMTNKFGVDRSRLFKNQASKIFHLNLNFKLFIENEYMAPEELSHIFKSKRDLYDALVVDSKWLQLDLNVEELLLPSYSRCPINFLRQLLSKEK